MNEQNKKDKSIHIVNPNDDSSSEQKDTRHHNSKRRRQGQRNRGQSRRDHDHHKDYNQAPSDNSQQKQHPESQDSSGLKENQAQVQERSDFKESYKTSKKEPFKNGQILKFIRVRFPGHNKSYPFFIGNRKLPYGQKVVAMSDRGMAVGYINSFPYEVEYSKNIEPIRSISKLATDKDILLQKENFHKEKDAEKLAIEFIEELGLEMDITHVEIIQFGKKAVFYFTAPGRVDFRNLVKKLVTQLKMRIELRQISIRDRVAAIGGLGACGLQTCCSSFLSKYGNVNIKMAKNQNFTLIGQRLNGVCGQLKCCISYEEEVYGEKRTKLPKEGQLIETLCGDQGRVERLHIIPEEFEMLTSFGALRRYSRKQFNKGKSPMPKDWEFPKKFDHVVDERSHLIDEDTQSPQF